ncbi:hypothetical protein FM107_19145 [Sphingobacterium sp. JB170]|nr:hypothetical protein FM107_19145 [Sphingobacterium sp. JB170]
MRKKKLLRKLHKSVILILNVPIDLEIMKKLHSQTIQIKKIL